MKWNDRVAARRTSSCSSRRTPSTRSTTSSWTVVEGKLGSSWSAWEKSQWNGRIEEVSEFYLRHYCEKKISRRSRYNSGTYLQNEINCMNDSRDFQDAESVHRGHSHVTSQPVSFPPFPDPGGMLSRSMGMPSRKDGRQAFGTRMVYRETFLQVQMRLLQHLVHRNWIHGVLICRKQFTHHRRRRMRIKDQFKIRGASLDRQPKIQSSLVREDFQRIVAQTSNDCRFQIFISTNSPHHQRLLVGR